MIKSKNYLITTDDWFRGPDGEQYKAVWGKAVIIQAKDALGFNPTRSTNWFVVVGEGDRSVFIAGCQIHYAVLCEKPPKIKKGRLKRKDGSSFKQNNIYIP